MGYHFGPLNDNYCLKSGEEALHLVKGCATMNTGNSPTAGGSTMKNNQQPRKKLSKKAATKKWLQTKAGKRWLSERIRIESDMAISHELRKFC